MMDTLHILFGEVSVGSLAYDRKRDEISLLYEEAWQFGTKSFPASLSLPLAIKTHPDESIRPFLQGLLPDNPAVIEAWGKRFQVSPRNPFDVVKHVGEDCAGALQFVRPERLDLILSGELDSLTPLSDEDLAKRMTDLQAQSRAVPVQFEGRFSLAGAQSKDALHLKDGKWFVPAGRIPSTHILKPQSGEYEEHALNEHFCLQLAANVGLMRADSGILEIRGNRVLCVKRYDRTVDPAGTMIRWHQEDTCQAMGRYPNQKYQADGGPGAAEIVGLLDRFSDDRDDDISRFIMALALNWVIAGTDAHSKNFSVLHGAGNFLRLAPAYDLASWLPYERDANSTKVMLAMKIGSTYRLHQIAVSHWNQLAVESGLHPSWVTACVQTLVQGVIDTLEPTRNAVAEMNDCPFLHKLADAIAKRARKCAELMDM
jgi:serine/threonine-protein kinase HipA